MVLRILCGIAKQLHCCASRFYGIGRGCGRALFQPDGARLVGKDMRGKAIVGFGEAGEQAIVEHRLRAADLFF